MTTDHTCEVSDLPDPADFGGVQMPAKQEAQRRVDELWAAFGCAPNPDSFKTSIQESMLQRMQEMARNAEADTTRAIAVERNIRIAQLEAIAALHEGTHNCLGGWFTDDPAYRGSIATRGPCPTRAILADSAGAITKREQELQAEAGERIATAIEVLRLEPLDIMRKGKYDDTWNNGISEAARIARADALTEGQP